MEKPKQPKCAVVGCRSRNAPTIRFWCEQHWRKWPGSPEYQAVEDAISATDRLDGVGEKAKAAARRPLVELAYRAFTRRMRAEARR